MAVSTLSTLTLFIVAAFFNEAAALAKFSAIGGMDQEGALDTDKDQLAALVGFWVSEGMDQDQALETEDSDSGRPRLTPRVLARLARETRESRMRPGEPPAAEPVFCPNTSDVALTEKELKIPLCNQSTQATWLSNLEKSFGLGAWKLNVMNAFHTQAAEAGHYLTVGTAHQSAALPSWLQQLSKLDVDVHVVHVGLDEQSHAMCEAAQAKQMQAQVGQKLPKLISELRERLQQARNNTQVLQQQLDDLEYLQQKQLQHLHPQQHLQLDGLQNMNANASSAVVLECVPLIGWLPSELFDAKDNKFGPGSCAYNVVEWAKPRILKAAVEGTDNPVTLLNADVEMLKDLRPLAGVLLSLKPGRVMVTSQEDSQAISTDVVYATKASTELLNLWADTVFSCMKARDAGKSALQEMDYVFGPRRLLATFPSSEVGRERQEGSSSNAAARDLPHRARRSATFPSRHSEPRSGAAMAMLQLQPGPAKKAEAEEQAPQAEDNADGSTATATLE